MVGFRQVVRRSLRAPAFALAVLLLVAAVVAVNATAFGAVYALRWKALPYHEGDRLVELRADLRKFGFEVGLSESLYRQVAAGSGTFAGAVGFSGSARPQSDQAGRDWRVQRVTPDFARVLGVAPALGRSFAHDDAVEGADAVLVLSDRAWRARFDADPGALGRTLRLLDREYTIVGVMPRGFAFPDAGTDAWMPYVASANERALDAAGNVGGFNVAARLAPGATVAQARERLAAIFAAADSLVALRENSGLEANVRPWRERYAEGHWRALALLQLAAVLLLAVVAANLANLVLDRLIARRREFSICRALGARERDVLGAVVADLVPPVLAGLALGLALAPLGTAMLRSRGLLPAELPQSVGGDAATWLVALAVAAFAAGIAMVAAMATLARDRAAAGLNERSHAAGLGRTRSAMLVGQIALTVALIGAAGLLLRSTINLLDEDRGFDAEGVLLTAVDMVGVMRGAEFDQAADGERHAPVVESLREAIAALPGVEQAAVSTMAPFSGWEAVSTVRVPGLDGEQQGRSRGVGAGYFAAMGIALVAGREFEAQDAGESGPVIVDELFVERYLKDVDPLTAHIRLPIDNAGNFRDARVVGVARTVKHEALDETPGLATYYVLSPTPLPVLFFVTRTAGDPAALADTVRRLVQARAPTAQVVVNEPLTESIAKTLVGRRALVEAVGLFAAVTLALAGLGLYAVLSFAVRRRTAELGVRMVLGATSHRILRLVMGQGGALIVAGVVIGLALGVPLARLLADRLHKLTPGDPLTWTLAAAAVALAALFACWLPARRATQVPPRVALQSE